MVPVSQTVNGNTVTVYPLYADANRIVLTYTVATPLHDVRAAPAYPVDRDGSRGYSAHLTDETGREFPTSYMLYGDQAKKALRQAWDVDAGDGVVLGFDPSGLAELPRVFQLHLVLDPPVFQRGSSLLGVVGPVAIDFSLPVDPIRRVAYVQQTITSAFDTATLERVVVTRHETRAFLRFGPLAPGSYRPYTMYTMLAAGGWSSHHDVQRIDWLVSDYNQDGPWSYALIGAPLIDALGEWRLSLWYMYTGNAFVPDSQGAEFRFTVPPVGAPAQPDPAGAPVAIPAVPTRPPLDPSPTPAAPVLLQQRSGGYTVTLWPVTADANRVVLRYNVTDPQGNHVLAFGVERIPDFFAIGPRLTDDAGTDQQLSRVGYSQAPESLFADAIELEYDTDPVENVPAVLKLHLVINLRQGAPAPIPVTDPITFDFALPVDPVSRVADVHQTVQGAGDTMTLERVIVTSAETRAIWRSSRSYESTTECADLTGTLQIGTQTIPLSRDWHYMTLIPRDGLCTYRYTQGSLLDVPGDWTLNIDELLHTSLYVSSSQSRPWVFHFAVPLATTARQP